MALLNVTNTNISSAGGGNFDDPLVIPTGATSYTIPADTFLQRLVILEPTAISLSIGTTIGGTEIVDSAPVNGNGVLSIDYYFTIATILYFTGVTASTVIRLYRR